MAVLSNSKHEQSAIRAKGISPTKAYISIGCSEHGAAASATRLPKNANVCSRGAELQTEISAGVIALEISSRNARVQALQDRWHRLPKIIGNADQRPPAFYRIWWTGCATAC